jgi:hypothetical protein
MTKGVATVVTSIKPLAIGVVIHLPKDVESVVTP